MTAAVRRLVCQLSAISGFGASKLKFSSLQRAIFDPFSVSRASHFSHLVESNDEHLFLIDNLTLFRSLEAEGVPSKQADAIIATTEEALNDRLENVCQSWVSKHKIEMMQESNKFKAEVQNSQLHHFSQLQNETEKLMNDIEKMCNELRYEIDKSTAGYRLDLQIEMGKIREEISNQKADTDNMINKLDSVSNYGIVWGLNSLELKLLKLVAAKDLIRNCCIGSISICATVVAVDAVLRMM